jgi:chain length determinant protein tyrosine kinase EpsG
MNMTEPTDPAAQGDTSAAAPGLEAEPEAPQGAAPGGGAVTVVTLSDRPERRVGELLVEAGEMTPEQVASALEHQQRSGGKFGECAIRLGLVRPEAVLWALARQRQASTLMPETVQTQLSEELVVAREPFGAAAEVMRDIRSQLIASVISVEAQPKRALAVTSVEVGEGKTWFASNLAISLSQLGSRTLLIDADLRTPRLHQIFDIAEPGVGLSGVLSGAGRLAFTCPIPELRRLFVLPAGPTPANPLELLQGPSFALLLRETVQQFDYVVVDTPAAEHGADGRVIAMQSGAAVTLSRKDQSRAAALREFVAQLSKGDIAFAGVVFNSA